MSALHAFIPRMSNRSLGMGLPSASLVKLNCLHSGVGAFARRYTNGVLLQPPTMSVVPLNILLTSSFHNVPHIRHPWKNLVWDKETRCWLNTFLVNI